MCNVSCRRSGRGGRRAGGARNASGWTPRHGALGDGQQGDGGLAVLDGKRDPVLQAHLAGICGALTAELELLEEASLELAQGIVGYSDRKSVV